MATDVHAASPEQLLEHADWLRALARALVRDSHDADDLAQETYAAALANPPTAGRPVRPWLAGVMRNLARFRARGAGRRQRREQTAQKLDQPAATPAELVERVQTQKLMADLVLRLDEPFRSTILLRYYEGYSAAQIARELDIPAGTVRWRLKRGLDQMRGELDRAHAGERKAWLAAVAPLVTNKHLTTGVIAVKTSTKVAAGIAVIVGLLLTGYFAGVFGNKKSGSESAAKAKHKPAGKFTTQKRPGLRFNATPNGVSVTLAVVDRPGGLRLEGQVIDDQDHGVGGATVAIDTNPVRQTMTESDGSFFFDKLSVRGYRLEARAGKLHAAGSVRLSKASDPVILRARAGSKLTVQVTSARNGEPVAGASVELRSTLMWEGTTGKDGRVELLGIGPGWRRLQVSANGYAPEMRMITNATARAGQSVDIRLQPGTPIAGKVVDAAGNPVAGARVWSTYASEPFPTVDPRIDAVVSDARGNWTMPGLLPGTYYFTASHAAHALTSSPPTYVSGGDGRTVTLRMRDGGSISGVVTGDDGPVAGAEVRAVAKGALAWRRRSHTVTDADGKFQLGGLPLRTVEVVALHDKGSSKIVDVDLAATPSASGLTLSLSNKASITGVVVDSSGDPLAEAFVAVQPEFKGALGERRAWQVRRSPVTRTDRKGRFGFAGLPAGKYRVRAARPDAPPGTLWLHKGVETEPGGKSIRVQVAGECKYTGRVKIADGSVPSSFTVRLDEAAAIPVASKDGAFTIAGPSGDHMLMVSGPSFIRKGVKATGKEGQTVDLGTIEVQRGRSVSGVVVDANGKPVAHAEVAAGRLLTGGGRELNIRSEGVGVQTTTTGDDGKFRISGFDVRPFTVVAGHELKGRSTSVYIPRGPKDATLTLKLEPVGSLAGRATLDGKPLAQTVIIASARTAPQSNFFVVTGEDGSFALDRLTPGKYIVQAMLGGGSTKPKDVHMRVATVKAGERGHVDVDVKTGPIRVTIMAKTDAGGPVPFAAVVLGMGKFDGVVNSEKLRKDYPMTGDRGAIFMRMSMGGRPATIDSVAPGIYSACVIPITNPALLRSPTGVQGAPAKCSSKALTADKTTVTYTVTVPAAWTKPPK